MFFKLPGCLCAFLLHSLISVSLTAASVEIVDDGNGPIFSYVKGPSLHDRGLEERGDCRITALLSVLHLNVQATSFCSSYLSIGTSTSTIATTTPVG